MGAAMSNNKGKQSVFERTITDEEKLSDAIANLEMAQYYLKSVSNIVKPEGKDKEGFTEAGRLITLALDYLHGLEIRNEIEDYSTFDDIQV